MPALIKRLVHSGLAKLGYRVVKIEKVPGESGPLGLFFSMVRARGFSPKHIIDVGANKGNWTRLAIHFFPDAEYTLVEPQDFLKTYIQDLIDSGYKIRWINAGAGNAPGKLQFTLYGRDDSSTFALTEEQARSLGLQQILVEVRTLNEILRTEGLQPPDILKIDAEGLDLQVLAGASELLGRTEIILVEALIVGGRENTLTKVIQRMDEAGYHILDITDVNRSPKYGVLWLCELAFLKNNSKLLDSVTSYD